jgi:integrase
MRKTLTDRGVAALKPRPQRYAFPDPQLTGHYVRVQPSGAKAFVTVARSPAGKQVWTNIGASDVLSIDEARERAREAIKRVRAGLPALAVPTIKHSFQDIAEQWLKRHAQAKGLRTEKQITRLLRVHVFPAWKDRAFLSIRRSDVAALLDHVEDHHGARQADLVLTVVRSVMNWHATRHDDYTPPLVRGMRRQDPKGQARARILADHEIRLIWNAAETSGTFGGIIRLALLTGQRRTKIAAMKWSDVSLDGAWTIPVEAREKGTAGELLLPPVALDIIRAQPRLSSNPHIFAGRGGGAFCGFSATKTTFDRKLPDVAPWVIHDLRRTARSLMSRAGVSSEHAERVMGHAISGVEGVYDRHSYKAEKADALAKLAALVDGIVNPRDNVTPIQTRAKRR